MAATPTFHETTLSSPVFEKKDRNLAEEKKNTEILKMVDIDFVKQPLTERKPSKWL